MYATLGDPSVLCGVPAGLCLLQVEFSKNLRDWHSLVVFLICLSRVHLVGPTGKGSVLKEML